MISLTLLVALAPPGAQAEPCEAGPPVLNLPPGFAPEGIAAARGHKLFVSSIADGSIYALDARTGTGALLVAPPSPRSQALGMKVDPRSNYLFVAGGNTGNARVYDTETGAKVAEIALTNLRPAFVNDVVITARAAYFTESTRPALYRLPLEHDGQLAAAGPPTEIALGGDFQFLPGKLNANGIAADPHGQRLFVINTSSGALYDVDAQTGFCTTVAVDSGPLTNGDGLLLRGETVYVVQNLFNQIAVLDLFHDGKRAHLARTITAPSFDIPTTAADLDDTLYVVNARYTTPHTPTTPYTVVRVPR